MCKFRSDPEQTSFLHRHSNQDDGRMPLTRQCKANFIPLMLINKLLSEKSMHFSSLNVCDKFLICLKMKGKYKSIWLLTGYVWTTTLAQHPCTNVMMHCSTHALQQCCTQEGFPSWLLINHLGWMWGLGVKEWCLQLLQIFPNALCCHVGPAIRKWPTHAEVLTGYRHTHTKGKKKRKNEDEVITVS